ncbi:hypothetical protein ACI68E_003708 [Malassezia pachydermatis]
MSEQSHSGRATPQSHRTNQTQQSKRVSTGPNTNPNRRSQHSTPWPNRPISGSMPQSPFSNLPDASNVGAMPDLMSWQAVPGQFGNTSLLADAYGASHGQPQSGSANLDWVNGMTASMLPEAESQNRSMPNHMIMQQGLNSMLYTMNPSQLSHQFNQLQLQSQQHEIAMQQNLLLSQIQYAQDQQRQAEMRQSAAVLNPYQNAGIQDFSRRPSSGMKKQTFQSPPNSRGLDSASAMSKIGSPREAAEMLRSMHLPASVSNAMPNMSAIRQDNTPMEYNSPSTLSTPRTPRPNSYSGRDRLQENWSSPSVGQSMRLENKRLSSLQREKPDGMERKRNVTPSIVIDQVRVEPENDELTRKANAVGMRIGPRTATVVHEVSLPNDTPSRPMVENDQRSLSRGSEIQRPNSSQNGPQFTIIQPRRQPRGPPMESFFANNFLARKSLRTRREAMSKLCSSPRAASFSGTRSATGPSPLSK